MADFLTTEKNRVDEYEQKTITIATVNGICGRIFYVGQFVGPG
jgi:hypothetical protein